MANPSFKHKGFQIIINNRYVFLFAAVLRKTQRSEIYRFCLYTLT